MPKNDKPSADELLALPLKEAVARLKAPAHALRLVNELLSRLPELGPQALRGAILVAATMHAHGRVEQLREVLRTSTHGCRDLRRSRAARRPG